MGEYLINKTHGSGNVATDDLVMKPYIPHNEFVANVLPDDICVIIFDLRGCRGCQWPKTSDLGAHFGTLTQCSVHPSAPVLLTKDSPRNFISFDSQPPFSLHISNSRTKPARLDF